LAACFQEQWKAIRHIYLNPADDGIELFKGIMIWIDKYNNRKHQGTKQKPNVRYQNAA
jgi:putative transposase